MRGKRGGNKTYDISKISTIQPRTFIRYPFSGRDKRRKIWVNHKNLLNIQTDTNKDNGAFRGTSCYYVPSLLLSNPMSLAPKIDEIAHVVHQQNIDIALFTETWLKESIPDDPINIEGRQLYRRDRKNQEHGGVCLYVKDSIQCKILQDFHSDDHEALWAFLRPKRLPRGFSNLIVAVVYHPDQHPDTSNAALSEYLTSSLDKIEANFPNSGILIAGDFNKFDFTASAKCYQLEPIIKFPTRGKNILDQIYTNLKKYYKPPTSGPAFGLSDHLSITALPNTRQKTQAHSKIIKTRDKRPSRVRSLGRFLLEVPWDTVLSQNESCDDKLAAITRIINYGLDTIMPVRSVKVHQTDRPWVNANLKRLIKKRQQALSSGDMLLFKMLRNKVNRERKKCRAIYYNNKVRDLKDTRPRNWWREVKQLCGSGRSTRKDIRSILRIQIDCTDQELADNINEAFVSVMQEYSPLSDDALVLCEDDEPISVTVESVAARLSSISASRAGGPDNLPNWVLKEFSVILAPALTDVLNQSFRESKVPCIWKLADVPPVPKGASIEDFNKDLRPISLTSTLSKIAEGFVIDQELKPLMLKCMDPNQFGFVPNSCTTFALISMLHHWSEATDGTGAHVRAALLDYKKAFDLVDHNILIAKLYSLGVKPTIVNWVADFLRNRLQRVKLNSDCFSNFIPVPAGIPQGTRIGPWLFLIMINDLTTSNTLSSIWKFADDTTVSEIVPKSGVSTLQETVNDVLLWSDDNRFQLNSLKCKELRIDFRRKNNTDTNFLEANSKTFEIVNSAKILGVTVRNDLKWNDHINNIIVKASQRIYLLKQLKRAGVDRESLIQFYCVCIRSILEYACQVFHSSLPGYLSDQIERVQKRVLRILFPEDSYSKALENAGLKSLFYRREELCKTLFKQIIESDGQHKLAGLLPARKINERYHFRKKHMFLMPFVKTKRFRNTFIMHYAAKE